MFWNLGGRAIKHAGEQHDVTGGAMSDDGDLIADLEHLSYVIECLATDVQGEAKYELGNLISSVEGRSGSAEAGEVLDKLKTGADYLRRGRSERAASSLCQASRVLWKRVLNG